MFTTLEGEDHRKFEFTDKKGNFGSIWEAVIPIIMFKGQDPREVSVEGTAFFIGQDILVTAKHVMDHIFVYDGDDDDALPNQIIGSAMVFQRGRDGKDYRREITNAATSKVADICIVKLEPIGLINPVLPLRRGMPKLREDMTTFGYPASVVKEGDEREIYLNGKNFSGSVVERLPRGRGRLVKGPCFRADFHMHGGASGGPVFDSIGRVCGVNCRSISPYTDVSYVTCIRAIEDLSVINVKHKGQIHDDMEIKDMFRKGILKYESRLSRPD